MVKDTLDVIVIGAGQAGLSMGYYLKQSSLSFLLLDSRSRAGESWRERYDSLELFTPRRYSQLPGLNFPGDPNALPNKDDTADYLQEYAASFALPIRFNRTVTRLEKSDSVFIVSTNEETFRAKQVVVATGPFQTPFIPAIAQNVSSQVVQLHTAEYKNPQQLQPGNVLVIGAGNSGVQIAAELAREKNVLLSVGHPPKFLPLSLFGKSIFWYFEQFGILYADISTKRGAWLRKQPDPIFGYKKELQHLHQLGRLQWKDRTISLSGTQAVFSDGSTASIDNLIWATGFKPDYSWIHMPGLLDAEGKPVHKRGVTPIKGLYFLGLSWQYRRTSALLAGVGTDALFLADGIKRHAAIDQTVGGLRYGAIS